MTSGLVFNIQRDSIHDGPGIRTTVFLKGCPLKCVWCQNPESISPDPEVSFNRRACMLCGGCAKICAASAHVLTDGKHAYLRDECSLCGSCIENCAVDALEMIGREMTIREVMSIVERDVPFYEASGGGVTISGGEPLMQFDFCLGLLKSARAGGIHTCLETSGFASLKRLLAVAEYVDLFLYDLKDSDEARHKLNTGVGLATIQSNLERLLESGAGVRLRCVIVPGFTDRDEHFAAIGAIFERFPSLQGVDIMGFHNLGREKYDRLDKEYRLKDLKTVTAKTKGEWKKRMESAGCRDVHIG